MHLKISSGKGWPFCLRLNVKCKVSLLLLFLFFSCGKHLKRRLCLSACLSVCLYVCNAFLPCPYVARTISGLKVKDQGHRGHSKFLLCPHRGSVPIWLICTNICTNIVHKQRVLMHRHQGLNVRHGLCHIYMRYLYIYELFIAFVCFVVCSLL